MVMPIHSHLLPLDGVNLDNYARKSSFPDVARNSYYEAAVNWGAENGVISGKNGNNVVPQGNAQRCEVAQNMYNIYINNIV